MKPNVKKYSVLALMIAGMVISGQFLYATIVGSPHDLSSTGPKLQLATAIGVCDPCHTPHNAPSAQAPLWDHQIVNTAAYTLYPSGGTLNSTPGAVDGVSQLCMSCHDGTLGVENFGGVTASILYRIGTDAPFAGSPANLGTDLSNDHPISITYDTALATADGALFNPATLTGVPGPPPGKTVTIGTATGTINQMLLFAGKVQCASCHNVHEFGATADMQPFMRITRSGAGQLCLNCHNK